MRSMGTNGASKNRDYLIQNGVTDRIERIFRFIEYLWSSFKFLEVPRYVYPGYLNGMYIYGVYTYGV